MICRVLPHIIAAGPANMALDEALLDCVSDENPGEAVFRTYGWSEPTLSLGYFQSIAEVRAGSRWAGAALVRRPTGGGAIWHEHEVTYALVLPRTHPLGRRAADLYQAVHGAIAALLMEVGAAARRRGSPEIPGTEKNSHRPFLCFTDHDPEDIVVDGIKLVGSAQRRRPGAILQHGSVLLARAEATPELPGLAELVAPADPGTDWPARLQQSVPTALGLVPRPGALKAAEQARALELERRVYREPSWTCKR